MTSRLEWVCDQCSCTILRDDDDGFSYCERCGNQAEFVDTARDDDDLFADGGIYSINHRRLRPSQNTFVEPSSQIRLTPALQFESFEELGKSCAPSNGGDTNGPTAPTDFGTIPKALSYSDYYTEIRLRYVMGFQVMVQLQCKVLVEKFNVSPLIVGIAGPIWLRLLASTKIMADGWADEVIHESESQLQGEAPEFQPHYIHRNEPHNMLGKRAVTVWHKSLSSSIPLYYSLGISFLVCHLARESVLPTDIVKWTIEGRIPYFSAFLEIEKQLGPPSSACPLSSSYMFRPIQVTPAQKLESAAAFIALKIGLQLPPVNFYGISSRFLNQLGVPVEEILPQACRIYEWSMPPELFLSANKLRTPTCVCVMAILLVTIRIIYDLNGYGNWEMSLTGSENSSFRDDQTGKDRMCGADRDLSSRGSECFRSSVSDEDMKQEVVDLFRILEMKYNELKVNLDYSVDLTSYLQYCKDVVFAGSGSSFNNYEEEILTEELWSYYQNQQGTEEGREFCSSVASGSLEGNRTENQSAHVLDKSTSKRPKTSSDESIRQLKADMDEHKFRYIPPRERIKTRSYIIYARKKKKGAYVYAAHADYYILLRACAKVAQVEIRALHCAVLHFERRLKTLEERINCCFPVKAPHNLSNFGFSEDAEDDEDDYADFS